MIKDVKHLFPTSLCSSVRAVVIIKIHFSVPYVSITAYLGAAFLETCLVSLTGFGVPTTRTRTQGSTLYTKQQRWDRIYKRKQEKKERKQELDQESDQEKKKVFSFFLGRFHGRVLSFFFSWSLSWPSSCFLSFFLVFFYKFPPQSKMISYC